MVRTGGSETTCQVIYVGTASGRPVIKTANGMEYYAERTIPTNEPPRFKFNIETVLLPGNPQQDLVAA